MNLESKFREYLVHHAGAKNLDDLPGSVFPTRKGDYYLAAKRSVFEVKSISSDRAEALKPWLQNRIETSSEVKNGMPVVFGAVSFGEIYEGHANKEIFEKQLDLLAARTLEDYVRSAKKQIYETKNVLECENGYGFLVILNEGFHFYETWFVYRMIQSMLKKIKAEQPKYTIDGVWYINESAHANREIDAVFIHESEELEDITPNEILDNLARGWASYRGYVVT